jgi:hypothetical protein
MGVSSVAPRFFICCTGRRCGPQHNPARACLRKGDDGTAVGGTPTGAAAGLL